MVIAMMIYDYDDEANDAAGEYTCDQQQQQPGGFWRRCGGGEEPRPPQQESQCTWYTVVLLVVPGTKNIMVHNCYIVVQNGTHEGTRVHTLLLSRSHSAPPT